MIRTVTFLEIDTQDDYMVSFWLDETGAHHITVHRSLEYEHLPLEERPKPELFTHEEPQPALDLLVAAEWDGTRVWLKSQQREFTLDVSRVEAPKSSIPYGRLALRRMNYDQSFDLMLRREPKKKPPKTPPKTPRKSAKK